MREVAFRRQDRLMQDMMQLERVSCSDAHASGETADATRVRISNPGMVLSAQLTSFTF